MLHNVLFKIIRKKLSMSKYEAEMTEIVSRFDFDVISALKESDFRDFGVMDSRKYASALLNLFEASKMSSTEITMVVCLFTAVKSKARVLKSMMKFRKEKWFKAVKSFIADNVVQYTKEAEMDDNLFAAVHIPSCLPFIAARCWLQFTDTPSVQKFLENLWAAQFNLAPELMARQKLWEETFWNVTVQRGSSNFETQGFQSCYWETKATDVYLLLDFKDDEGEPASPGGSRGKGKRFGSEEVARTTPYSEAAIRKWIGTKVIVQGLAVAPPGDDDEGAAAPARIARRK